MTQSSMSTPYARRLAEKFRESQAYLRANGFWIFLVEPN